jgi:Lrp/AsnC family transcriptional regulator for asnA, asnC and gidA
VTEKRSPLERFHGWGERFPQPVCSFAGGQQHRYFVASTELRVISEGLLADLHGFPICSILWMAETEANNTILVGFSHPNELDAPLFLTLKGGSAMKVGLDLLDRSIIRLLQQDGRVAAADIARRLEVSERTVRNRIARMREQGAVLSTLVVNPKYFGYQMAVDVFCEVDMVQMKEVGNALRQLPEVNYVAYSTGDQDISIQAVLESSDAVYDFVQRLSRIPGIERTRTVLVPRILKDTYEWIPPEEDFEAYESN